MFWSDPNLYGATFPYRDVNLPMQTPFMGPVISPWQNIPRFMPPVYGFTPPLFDVPQIPFNLPQMPFNPVAFTPFMHTPAINPFMRSFDVTQTRPYDLPHLRPYDLPLYNLYRPFAC